MSTARIAPIAIDRGGKERLPSFLQSIEPKCEHKTVTNKGGESHYPKEGVQSHTGDQGQ